MAHTQDTLTHRHTDTQRHTETHTDTHRHTQAHTDTHRDTHRDTVAHRHTKNMHTQRHLHMGMLKRNNNTKK